MYQVLPGSWSSYPILLLALQKACARELFQKAKADTLAKRRK
jgi:hypothetical protein